MTGPQSVAPSYPCRAMIAIISYIDYIRIYVTPRVHNTLGNTYTGSSESYTVTYSKLKFNRDRLHPQNFAELSL